MATWTLDRPASTGLANDIDLATDAVALANSPGLFLNATDVSIATQSSAVSVPGWGDDTYGMNVRIVSGATILAAANAGGTYVTVQAASNIWGASKSFPAINFAYVNTTATKAQWDAATIEYQQTYTKTKGSDAAHIEATAHTNAITVTYTLDTAAPVLTSPVESNLSDKTAALSYNTDKITGTAYYFVSTSATAPSAAVLKAGTGAVDSGSITSTDFAQRFTATGLTASTTYYAYFIQNHVNGDSNILESGSWSTVAAATNVIRLDPAVVFATDATLSYPVAPESGRCLVVGVSTENNNATIGAPTVTYGGQSMTQVVGVVQFITDAQRTDLFFLNDAGIEAATSATIVVTGAGDAGGSVHCASYRNVVQTTPTVTNTSGNNQALSLSVTFTTSDDGVGIAFIGHGTGGATTTWTGGVTEQTDFSYNDGSADICTVSYADELIVTGAAETYTATFAGIVSNRISGAGMFIGYELIDTGDSLTADNLQSASQLSTPAVVDVAPGLYLYPDADTSIGNWTTDAGSASNLYQQIDEVTANDSDYVRSEIQPVTSKAKFRLSNSVPKPVASADQWVKYRYQKSGDAGAPLLNLTVRLIEGASTIRASWTHTNISATLTDASQLLTGPQKSSITDYDDLFIEFEADIQ